MGSSVRPLVQHERAMWLLLLLGGVGALSMGWTSTWHPVGLLAFLLALTIAADLFTVTVPGKGSVTPMASGLVLAVMFLGPLPAAALALASSLVDGVRRGVGRPATIANSVCHVWLTAVLGAGAYLVEQQVNAFDAGPFLVGFLTYLTFSTLTFVWLVWTWSTEPWRHRAREQYFPMLPVEVLVAFFTGGAAELYSRHDDAALGIVAAAIVSFQYVSRQLQLHEHRAQQLEDLAETRRRLVARVAEADAHQRRSLARELHDGPLQALLAARQDAAELAEHPERAAPLEQTLAAAIADLRDATLRLHPLPLRQLGFDASVSRFAELLAERHGFRVTLSIACPPEEGAEDLAYSVVLELLANAGKHAGAQQVAVQTAERDGAFLITVSDDGKGFSKADRAQALANGHVGLAALSERVRERGGSVEYEDRHPGVRVRVALPKPVAARAIR
jgi:signal transduction histidine kinase